MARPGRRFGLAARASLFAGALVVVSAGGVGLATYLSFDASLIQREKETLLSDGDQLALRVSRAVERLRGDASFLAGTNTFRDMAHTAGNGGVDPLAGANLTDHRRGVDNNFVQLLNARPEYLEVRLIDIADGGTELVRAEQSEAGPRLVTASELQQKGMAPYFQEAIEKPPGVVSVSAIELNREDGKIRVPHVPVLRAAVALRDRADRPFGVVVVSLDFGRVLESLAEHLPPLRHLYVVNQHGDFLWHPDPSRRFRFELGEPYRLAQEFPDIDPALWEGERFTAAHREANGEEMILGVHREAIDRADPERQVGVLLDVPTDVVLAGSRSAGERSLLLAMLLIPGAIGFAFWATRGVMRLIGGEPAEIGEITARVASGDLDIEFDERQQSAGGILGSVRLMVDALRESRMAMRERVWLTSELARVLTVAQSQSTLPELSRVVITELARLCQAGAGAFFARTLESEAERSLVLLGTFAHEERRRTPDRVRPGDGLVGQCVLEKQPILLTSVPAEYVRIQSGLGNAAPLQVLVLPVIFGDEAVAAIELASFEPLGGIKRELLDQVSANLGVIVSGLLAGERTARLLEETQALSEKAQAQSEELRVSNEELEERGQTLEGQRSELEAQGEELRIANEQLADRTVALERQNKQSQASNEQLTRAREELEGKAKLLESASGYKSEFLANMSHELRTPLNSLLILARSLADNREGNLTADQKEAASVIHQSGKDLLGLINDILDLSKVEAGKLELSIEELDPHQLARDLHEEFHGLSQQSGLAFRIETTGEAPLALRTDRQRLRQILRNLLGNAFKFTARGSVTLRVGLVAGDPATNRCVSFSVADTGVGISADKFEAIFDAFQQADGSVTRRYGGTGLGLTISRKLAALLGGRIDVTSEEEQGSTFTVLLPERGPGAHAALPAAPAAAALATAPPAAAVLAPAAEPSSTPGTPGDAVLLIIEDDADFASTIAQLAHSRGYRTWSATTGGAGLAAAVEKRPTAILLDLGLPDLDGARVLERLKSDPRTRHIPVHVISGRAEQAELRAIGAIGFLQKPVSAEELEAAFRRIESAVGARLKTVLAIDDDATARRAVRELLGTLQVRVVEAASGAEARERISTQRFDCIVLDLSLGDVDGHDLLREFAQTLGRELPPVIVYTARDLSSAEDRALREHAQTVVVKGPTSPERLLDEVSLFLHSVEASLPARHARPPEALLAGDRVLTGRSVLLVDDDMRSVYALSRFLRDHGMEVSIAENGAVALEHLANESHADVVLMDLMMPVMDGYEATRRIRADATLEGLPIIALTAKAMPADRERCLAAGANDYLVKPVDLDRLLSLLRVWLFERK